MVVIILVVAFLILLVNSKWPREPMGKWKDRDAKDE